MENLIKYEWVDFTIIDLSYDEEYEWTKEKFENEFGVKFECVELNEQGKPKYIWTDKYVFQILTYTRFLNQLYLIGVPRNPDYKKNG